MRLDWKVVLGFAISGGLLWWLFRDQDLGALWSQVRQARPGLFLAAVTVATSAYAIRVLRWEVLLSPIRENTSFSNRWATTMIGFMANNLLPARMGEVVRAYALSRVEPVPMSGAFGTLVVARFLDAIAVFGLLGVAVLLPSFPAEAAVGGVSVGAIARVGAILLLVGVLGVGALVAWPQGPAFVMRATPRLLGRDRGATVVAILETFLDGLAVLRDPRRFVHALLLSLAHWLYYGLAFWLALESFGLELGYGAALLVQGVVAVGVAVPSAPGFFGTWHGAAQVALAGTYGVPETQALAFATAFHLGGFVPITVLGLYYAWRLRISVRRVSSDAPVPA